MANRHIPCKDCGKPKWISQKQFRNRVESEGTPKKAKLRFQCSQCKSLEKNDLFTFQIKFGKPLKKFRAEIRKILKKFEETGDLAWVKEEFNKTFLKNYIDPNDVTYHYTDMGKLEGLTLRNTPFVGDVYVSIFTQREYDKTTNNGKDKE